MTESAKMILLSDQLHTLSTSSMVPEPLVTKRLGDHKSCADIFGQEKNPLSLLDIKLQFLI